MNILVDSTLSSSRTEYRVMLMHSAQKYTKVPGQRGTSVVQFDLTKTNEKVYFQYRYMDTQLIKITWRAEIQNRDSGTVSQTWANWVVNWCISTQIETAHRYLAVLFYLFIFQWPRQNSNKSQHCPRIPVLDFRPSYSSTVPGYSRYRKLKLSM